MHRDCVEIILTQTCSSCEISNLAVLSQCFSSILQTHNNMLMFYIFNNKWPKQTIQ